MPNPSNARLRGWLQEIIQTETLPSVHRLPLTAHLNALSDDGPVVRHKEPKRLSGWSMPTSHSAELLRQLAAEAAKTAQSIVDPELRLQVLLIAARYSAMVAASDKFADAAAKPETK